jgi:hypothetical protein
MKSNVKSEKFGLGAVAALMVGCLVAGLGASGHRALAAEDSEIRPMRVQQTERRVSEDGKRARVVLSLSGSRAGDAAGMRLWLSVDRRRIGRIALSRRLQKSGFVLNVARERRKATIVVSPPPRLPLPVFGEGKLLRVGLPTKAGDLKVERSEFGSTKGMPLNG